jgi:holliday junction DNA helicase RuvA
MIGALNGTPLAYDNGVVSLACGEVVYEIVVNNRPKYVYGENDPALEPFGSEMYWTHAHYPEQGSPTLYGFREKAERDMFRRLIAIDGVGCKVAMRSVGHAMRIVDFKIPPDDAQKNLSNVRGVGPKIAQRIAEELSK